MTQDRTDPEGGIPGRYRPGDHSGSTEPIPSTVPQRAEIDALIDMRQRKDEAYLERNRVVAALAKLFPSGIARTAIPGWDEEWNGCVYIDLPAGQVSWHYHDSQAYLFASLPTYGGVWDGHDTPEKYRRLARLRPAEPLTANTLHRDQGFAGLPADRYPSSLTASPSREPSPSFTMTISAKLAEPLPAGMRERVVEVLRPLARDADRYEPDEGDDDEIAFDTHIKIGTLRAALVIFCELTHAGEVKL